jgi:DNA-binding GntR family transcriptional regulator
VLTSAAEETPIEDAHAAGMAVPSGAVDRAVQRMSPEELHALDQLLRREMQRAGA